MASKILRWFLLLIVLAGLGAGGYYAKKTYLDSGKIDFGKLTGLGGTPSKSDPGASPAKTDPDVIDTPTPKPGPIDSPNYKLTDANAKAREDVLKRIEVMPRLNDEQRDELRDAVRRARNMGCIFIIPFQNGQRTLDPHGTDILVNGFKSAAIQQLMKDPTVVFVVLGYADKQGDAGNNEKVSYERAQSVLTAMKDRCSVVNVTYAVAMGGADMYAGKSTANKNRLVEVWAAFP